MTVAQTILTQLGGNKFLVMTGAKNLLTVGEAGLQFDLPRTRNFVKDGINKIQIVLDPSDTYTVKFYKLSKLKCQLKCEIRGIYADSLQDIFTKYTGLECSL